MYQLNMNHHHHTKVYPTHRKTMIRVWKGKKDGNHIHKGEYGQKVFQLKKILKESESTQKPATYNTR